ncbi:hypothetical protein A2U01_0048606 [Trifolium medium]|uniref:Uncharacterized protein n=1 Tax=Trifolium medium TaxID=97028 RepID=A0A392QTS7_9FABA|nr:hypothetical protein [Trifolium medium]
MQGKGETEPREKSVEREGDRRGPVARERGNGGDDGC